MYKIIFCLMMPFLLTACVENLWLGNEKKEKLSGERVAIGELKTPVQIENSSTKIQLPAIASVKAVNVSSGNNNMQLENLSVADDLKQQRTWKLAVNNKFTIANMPIITEELIIVKGTDGIIRAYNKVDNKLIWDNKDYLKSSYNGFFNLSNTLNIGGMLAHEGILYVTSGNNEVVALDLATGQKKWVAMVANAVRSIPQITESKLLIVQSVDDQVYGIKLDSGEVVWSFFSNKEDITILHSVLPITLGDIVITQNSSGEIVGIDGKLGKGLWELDLTSKIERLAIRSEMHDVIYSPIVYRNSIIAYGNDGILVKLNAEKGIKEWESKLEINRPFWIAGNAVFALDRFNKLLALDINTGKIIWSHQLDSKFNGKVDISWTSPIVINNNVIIINSAGTLQQINALNGELVTSQTVVRGVYSRPIIVDDKMYLVSHTGQIVEYGKN